jgi:hypothetical protein
MCGNGVLHVESGVEGGDVLTNDILGAGSGAESGGNGLGADVCGIDSCKSGGIGGRLVAKGGLRQSSHARQSRTLDAEIMRHYTHMTHDTAREMVWQSQPRAWLGQLSWTRRNHPIVAHHLGLVPAWRIPLRTPSSWAVNLIVSGST